MTDWEIRDNLLVNLKACKVINISALISVRLINLNAPVYPELVLVPSGERIQFEATTAEVEEAKALFLKILAVMQGGKYDFPS